MHILLPILFSIVLSLTTNHKAGMFLSQQVKSLTSPIYNPLKGIRQSLYLSFTTLSSLPELTSQNHDLILENALLKSQLQYLAGEVQLTNLPSPTTAPNSYNIIDHYPQAIIKTDTNINVDTPVTVGNILLGYTGTSQNHITPITSLQDITIKIAAVTDTQVMGNIISQDGQITFTDATSEKPLALGSTIFTRTSPNTPANLVVGQITKILSRPADPIQKAVISPPLDLSTQKFIEINP